MSNSKQPFIYILLFLILGGLVFFTLRFSNKNNIIQTELESIKAGNLNEKSIKYDKLSPDVFTMIQLEKEDGTTLIAKVLKGTVENGNLSGKVSLETNSGEKIEANVINTDTKNILEDIDGNQLIAKLGQQWILPNHFSQESIDYLSNELNLTPQTTNDVLTGKQILTKLGNQWLLVDDLSGEVTTYISDEISTAISNITFPDTSLADGSVLEVHLADGSVSNSKIQNGAVTISNMSSNSVSTAQIIDGNITLAKLANNSVDSSKIVNNTIINEDISNSASIDWDKISKLGSNLSDLGNRNSEYISIADTGGYFTGSDVEAVLQEIADGTTLDGRYLQSYSETDPVYILSVASGITGTDVANWDSAYSWGDHSTQGYLTSEVDGSTTNELQNLFNQLTDGTNTATADSQTDTFRIVGGDNIDVLVGNDNGTYGDYLSISSVDEYVGTLTSLTAGNGLSGGTVTDTGTFSINSPTCTGTDKLQWNGTGFICSSDVDTNTDTNNYADGLSFGTSTGVLTLTRSGLGDLTVNLDGRYLQSYSETDPVYSASSVSGITSTNIANWNTAYGWGNHSTQGYITDGNTNWNNSYGFITSSSTNTLTNKSGNISMWTNNVGYITSSQVSDAYLLNTTDSMSGNLTVGGGHLYIGNDAEWQDGGTNILYTPDSLNVDGYTYLDGLRMDGILNSNNQWISGDGGAEGIHIADNGNVGIGTTNSSYKLFANGSLRATNYYSGDGTQGSTTTVSGLTFKDGLYTSGTVNSSATSTSTYRHTAVFQKSGNNGSVTCNTYCQDSQYWGEDVANRVGSCVGAVLSTGSAATCSTLNQGTIYCLCFGMN